MIVQAPDLLAPGPVAVVAPSTAGPRVHGTTGATILQFGACNATAAEDALRALRGLRTPNRRVLWCQPGSWAHEAPAEIKTWARRAVAVGGVGMAVVEGEGARELAHALRDSGLSLSRVIVCRDEATARNVLCDSLAPGDVVLALGVDADNCQRLSERLEWRFEQQGSN